LIVAGVYPWLSLVVAVGIVFLVVFLLFKVRVVLGVAWDIYRPHWLTFLGIGLLTIPIGIAFNGFAYLITTNPPGDWFIKWFGDTNDTHLGASIMVGIFQQVAMLLLISPAVIEAVGEIRDGRKPEVIRSYRLGFENIKILIGALIILVLVTSVLVLTIVGIPIAIWFLVRWFFFGEAIILDGASSGRAGLGRSARIVDGHWWIACGALIALNLVGGLPGPLVGVFLLIFRGRSVEIANAVSSVIYAVLIPIVVIGMTVVYLYLDRRVQSRREPVVTPEGPVTPPEVAPAS